jgi:hypothetical protein
MIVIRIRDIAAEVPILRVMVGATHWLAESSHRFWKERSASAASTWVDAATVNFSDTTFFASSRMELSCDEC